MSSWSFLPLWRFEVRNCQIEHDKAEFGCKAGRRKIIGQSDTWYCGEAAEGPKHVKCEGLKVRDEFGSERFEHHSHDHPRLCIQPFSLYLAEIHHQYATKR